MMKQVVFKLVVILMLIPALCVAQFTSQGNATNYGGGSTSGGSFDTEFNTSVISGFPTNDLNGIYLGLSPFNLESGVITVLSTSNGNPITDPQEGTLLRIEPAGSYDTIDIATNNGGDLTFNPVFIGDYLVVIDSDPEKFVATYFGDAVLWEEADVLTLSEDSSIAISVVEVPTVNPGATGNVSGTIDEDFGEDEEARITARRRAKRRKCGLRRRRTGGRTEQDGEFELIAYGETNDQGEFEYGFLPEGTYRFFVEYPGIPLDESSFVQFEIGESGVSDDTFVLAVFASEEGITIELVLGVTSQFFTDFKLYPNPAQDFIQMSYDEILSEQMTFEIVNMDGKTLLKKDLTKVNNQELRLDISKYPQGLYFLKFIDQSKRRQNELVFKFLKK